MSNSVGLPEQDAITVTGTATQLVTAIGRDIRQLTFVALSSNTASVFLGSSSVASTGANRGLEIPAGDEVHVLIDGQHATAFYAIRDGAAANQTVNVTQSS